MDSLNTTNSYLRGTTMAHDTNRDVVQGNGGPRLVDRPSAPPASGQAATGPWPAAMPTNGSSRSACHVGRVGALALALGVGFAVVTGHTFGLGVARADDASSSPGRSESSTKSDRGATKSSNSSDEPPSRGSDAKQVRPSGKQDKPSTKASDDEDQPRSTSDAFSEPSPDDAADPTPFDRGNRRGSEESSSTGERQHPLTTRGSKALSEPDIGRPQTRAATPVNPDPAKDSVHSAAHPAEVNTVRSIDVVTPDQPETPDPSTAATDLGSVPSHGPARPTPSPSPAPLAWALVAAHREARSKTVREKAVGTQSTSTVDQAVPGPQDDAATAGEVQPEVDLTETPLASRSTEAKTTAAADDRFNMVRNLSKTFTAAQLLGNDTTSDPSLTLAVHSVGQATHGTAVKNANGTVTFTPDADYTGLASFTYSVVDSSGVVSANTATVTLNVKPTNSALVAKDRSFTIAQGTRHTFTAKDLVDNADGALPAEILSVNSVGAATHGTVVRNADGTVTFTPDANYTGQATFIFRIKDAIGAVSTNVATVTLTITPSVPTAVDDRVNVVKNQPKTMTAAQLLANDTAPESGRPLTVSWVGGATHGTVVRNANGTITFTPDADYTGQASFTYRVADANGTVSTNTATVILTVKSVNNALVAVADNARIRQGTRYTFKADDLVSNDIGANPGDVLSVNSVGGATHGTVVRNADGTVTFTPDANYTGQASFYYRVKDSTGAVSENVAKVTMKITATGVSPTRPTIDSLIDLPGANPVGEIFYSADGTRAYQTISWREGGGGPKSKDEGGQGSATVSTSVLVLDTATNELTRIDIDGSANGSVQFSPDGAHVYQSTTKSSYDPVSDTTTVTTTITAIRGATSTVQGTVTVNGTSSGELQFKARGAVTYAYLTTTETTGGRETGEVQTSIVTAINTTDYTTVTATAAGSATGPVVLSDDGSTAYLATSLESIDGEGNTVRGARVYVIDTTAGGPVDGTDIAGEPTGRLVLDADGSRLYLVTTSVVTDPETGIGHDTTTVTTLRANDATAINTLAFQGAPNEAGLQTSRDGRHIYLTTSFHDQNSNTFRTSVVDVVNRRVVLSDIEGQPVGSLVFSDNGRVAIQTTYDYRNSATTVTVLDTDTGTVRGSSTLAGTSTGAARFSTDGRAYWSTQDNNSINVAVVDTVGPYDPQVHSFDGYALDNGMEFGANGRYVYVTTRIDDSTTAVNVIDTAGDNSRTHLIAGRAFSGIRLSADGTRAYQPTSTTTNPNTGAQSTSLTIFDTATGLKSQTVTAQGTARGMEFTADGKFAYLLTSVSGTDPETGNRTVSSILTTVNLMNNAIATLALPGDPDGDLRLNPVNRQLYLEVTNPGSPDRVLISADTTFTESAPTARPVSSVSVRTGNPLDRMVYTADGKVGFQTFSSGGGKEHKTTAQPSTSTTTVLVLNTTTNEITRIVIAGTANGMVQIVGDRVYQSTSTNTHIYAPETDSYVESSATTITVIEAATGGVIDTIELAGTGGVMQFSNDGERIFQTTVEDKRDGTELIRFNSASTTGNGEVEVTEIDGRPFGATQFTDNHSHAFVTSYHDDYDQDGNITTTTTVTSINTADGSVRTYTIVGVADGAVQFDSNGHAYQTTHTAVYDQVTDRNIVTTTTTIIDISGNAATKTVNTLGSLEGALQFDTSGHAFQTTHQSFYDYTTGVSSDTTRITVIDTGTSAVIRVMTIDGYPYVSDNRETKTTGGIVQFSADGTKAYAVTGSGNSTTVIVMDLTTLGSASVPPVGFTMEGRPSGAVVFSGDGQTAYWTTDDDSTGTNRVRVAVLDTATVSAPQIVEVTGNLHGRLQVSPTGSHAYFTTSTTEYTDDGNVLETTRVTVIDATTEVPTSTTVVINGASDGGVQLSPDGTHVLQSTTVSDPNTGENTVTITVVNVATGAHTSTAGVTGRTEGQLVFSADGTRAYQTFVHQDPRTGAAQTTIAVIDLATAIMSTTITLDGNPTGAVQLSADGKYAIQLTSGFSGGGESASAAKAAAEAATPISLTVIDTSNNATTTLSIPGERSGIAEFSPDGTKILVWTQSESRQVIVSVIDTASTGDAVVNAPTVIDLVESTPSTEPDRWTVTVHTTDSDDEVVTLTAADRDHVEVVSEADGTFTVYVWDTDWAQANPDTPIVVTVTATDGINAPVTTTVTVGTVGSSAVAISAVEDDGSVTYASGVGPASFDYRITDGLLSTGSTVTVTIAPGGGHSAA